MKLKRLFLSVVSVPFATITSADIIVHGSTTAYTETGGDWLTMGSNDIDSSGGLGTDGFIFYGNFNGTQQSGQPYSTHVASLPSYVTSHGPGADNTGNANADEFPGYGAIDNPILLDGTDNRGGITLGTGGVAGAVRQIMTFEVSGLALGQTTRVGVLAGIEANNDGRWDPTSITLTQGINTATVGDHTTSPLPANPGGTNTGWVFFDIDADGTYNLSGTKRLAGQGASIGGLTFDSVVIPEPSSGMLFILGVLVISLRRRR